ncbi:hypothetical protein BpHYR1_037465 [Brachionus plicatilis]|uniref:Uncharacterized protein n=1 Tax=Brachionus plicatilis TaxID=10195 RepID=A0A3M7S6A0_BRAPC|nr:hypothetical protein BpHYR1_037465 [Brachionus plicatilis]
MAHMDQENLKIACIDILSTLIFESLCNKECEEKVSNEVCFNSLVSIQKNLNNFFTKRDRLFGF